MGRKECMYEYAFNSYYNTAMRNHQAYQNFKTSEEKNQQSLNNWNKEKARLAKQASDSGVAIDRYLLDRMERELDDINTTTYRNEQARKHLESNIILTFDRLYEMFHDIQNDYEHKIINSETYIGYLQKYKDILDSGNGINCYNDHRAQKIKEQIHIHLPLQVAA